MWTIVHCTVVFCIIYIVYIAQCQGKEGKDCSSKKKNGDEKRSINRSIIHTGHSPTSSCGDILYENKIKMKVDLENDSQ